MLRNLIIVAVVIIVFMILRKRLSSSAHSDKTDTAVDSESMVQCLSCETYVPEDEAIRDGDRVFCCPQHLREWTDSSQ